MVIKLQFLQVIFIIYTFVINLFNFRIFIIIKIQVIEFVLINKPIKIEIYLNQKSN